MFVNSFSQIIKDQTVIPYNVKGVIIRAVIQGSSSDTAGLKVGYVITKWNNK